MKKITQTIKWNKAALLDRNSQQTKKKSLHAELARKRDAAAFITKNLVLFAAYDASVAGL